jgi:tetratricopeptide (TPR) repeat protein
MSVRIFLSTVSDEFRDYRDQLRTDLTRHNVEVKVQEDFKDLGTVTLDKLDAYIAACDAVIHLVGKMTGAAAKAESTTTLVEKYPHLADKLAPLRELLETRSDISYTQWEAWLALYHGKLLQIAQAHDEAPRGPRFTPTEESCAAQRAHLERLRAVERYPGDPFTSPDNLAKQILSGAILDLLAREALSEASIDEIETAVRAKSPKLTDAQINRFIQSLRELKGDPSFARAVEEALKGNTRVAEGIWLQIYEDRKKERRKAQQEQAEAARNLAASAVTNSVADGLKWYREATDLDPDNMAGWGGLGDAAVAAGTLKEADAAFLKYIELARRARNEREVGVGLERRGDVQVAQGDLAGALTSYRDSLAIRDRLAQSDPGNAGWRHDLSASYDRVGDVQVAQGDLAGALTSYRDSLAIFDRLAQSDPGNAGWRRDLSVSFNKVGDVQVAQGDLAGALTSYRDGLAIRDRLAQSDPGNAGWRRDLSVSYNKVGDVQVEQGDLAGALTSYRDSLAIADRLAKSDPGNAGWQRDLSVSYEKIGNVQAAQGDLAGALKSYSDSLAIADRLAQSDPGNAGWRRDLSVSYERVGDVQVAQGDLASALTSYRDGFTIINRLAEADPGNAGWQRDLAVSHSKIAITLQKMGNGAEALAALRRGHEIMVRVAALSPDNAIWKGNLAWFEAQIAEISG